MTAEEIKRYDVYYYTDLGEQIEAMNTPAHDGEWVKYEDHLKILNQCLSSLEGEKASHAIKTASLPSEDSKEGHENEIAILKNELYLERERNGDMAESWYKCIQEIKELKDGQAKGIPTDEILGLYNAWPLRDVLERLAQGMEILLHDKGYDGNWHEEFLICMNRANEIRALLSQPENSRESRQEPSEGQDEKPCIHHNVVYGPAGAYCDICFQDLL